jgi:anti-anti-sigma factor
MNIPRARHPSLRLRTTRPAPQAVLVTVHGDLDCATAGDLAAVVADRLAAAPGRLVLDLSEVDFLGVAGVRALLHAARQADRHGAELHVVANPVVRRALRVTGADLHLTVSEHRPEPAPV